MLKFSIVIPAFNVGHYINRCILSCLEQDLSKEEYEIIIINDGSTDNTLTIIERLSEDYQNIKIISITNQGPGAARNKGLMVASGKYIWFVDADDWIKSNSLNYLYTILETNALDALWVQLRRVNEKGDFMPVKRIHKRILTHTMSGEEFLRFVFGYEAYVVLFVFRRAFLVKAGLRFMEDVYYEDAEFTPRALTEAKRVKYEMGVYYFYIIRPGSIINAHNPRKIDDLLKVIKSLNRTIEKNEGSFDISYIRSFISVLVLNAMRLSTNEAYIDKQANLMLHLKNENLLELKPPSGFLLLIETWIYNISPRLFLIVCKIGRYFKGVKCIKTS